MPPSSDLCPCESNLDYDDCCGPFHRKEARVQTAEALMRARYSAYVKGLTDFLVETTMPQSRHPKLHANIEAMQGSMQWIGLEVIRSSQGEANDRMGKVEFRASFIQKGEQLTHHELSRFRKHQGHWHYLDGIIYD